MTHSIEAPGAPGILPRWTSSGKVGVGTSVTGDSNVWFTLSHGIINEVYYPRVDIANIRDMEFLVTDGQYFFSEEKRHTVHYYKQLGDGVPAFEITNVCREERYRIVKTVITDPRRNVLLQKIEFTALKGRLDDYKLYLLLAPHIDNSGLDNTGWAGDYKGIPMLFAQRNWITIACAASTPFLQRSCGYVGVSDAWTDLFQNKKLTAIYDRAERGNIALTAEIDLKSCGGVFSVALAFANNPEEAGLQTRASLTRGFDLALKEYTSGWECLQNKFINLSSVDSEGGALYRISTAVLKTHEGKHFSGSVIASLSIPWGYDRDCKELGGYHLIWPRDQVQTAQALLAAGDMESARQALLFLLCTQEDDGHWSQCMWEDGLPYWGGLQMDETALPIILADQLKYYEYLHGIDPWPMIAKAASFIIKNGPFTDEDRWEENGGYTPFTIAAEIAALLVAADWFEERGQKIEAEHLRIVADWWNYSIEKWLYEPSKGYYVRLRPRHGEKYHLKNRKEGESEVDFRDIISVDALALVRFGLRKTDDPKIKNTLRAIDDHLRTETKKGPVWHRYNGDGYGEPADGTPFENVGVGRGWPLLSGERAHYELAAGNKQKAIELLRDMARLAGEGGLLPEQIWDSEDIPAHSLFNGHSAGAAKPLVWAHAEYIILLRSLKDGQIFDMPRQTRKRYLESDFKINRSLWDFKEQPSEVLCGVDLRIQLESHARVKWTSDGWKTENEVEATVTTLGIWFVDLPIAKLPKGTQIEFTFFWTLTGTWESKNYSTLLVCT